MLFKKFKQEAYRELVRNSFTQQWINERVANIHKHVTAADVLSRHGVELRRNGSHEEQLSCPFHGDDKKPSARYYPESASGHSSVWCFVCREQWDALTLWKKFNGEEKFSALLSHVERAFGITPPEYQGATIEEEEEYDPLEHEVEILFQTCESRLKEERNKMDMPTHLRIGSILDQLRYQINNKTTSLEDGKNHLNQILSKIREKTR